MLTLVTMKFGSHLYGTDTPASDLDFKAVHVPGCQDILLQRVRDVISTGTKTDPGARNGPGDVDSESFSLQKYLKLAAQGQTVAIDMLFAPEWAWLAPPDGFWESIVRNRDRLLTRKSASFVGYCRTQANKYGIRGSRVAAARAALTLLAEAADAHGGNVKLYAVAASVEAMATGAEHMDVTDIEGQHGVVRHWSVCDRKMPYTASIKSAREIMQRVVDEYGHRALAAERNEGIDWKALSHAVRIANQAVELLTTANVTFPRPEAAHLKAIKAGQLSYAAVADEIDAGLLAVEAAASASTLPDAPDLEWIDTVVAAAYGIQVRVVG